MAAFQASSAQFDLSFPTMDTQTQVELIWQMGAASLRSNNHELVLPQHMGTCLTQEAVENLKLRLSQHLNGAATIAFEDREVQVFRICRVPQLVKTGDFSGSQASPAHTSPSSKVSSPVSQPTATHRAKNHVKKAKVPRPANAFILYRKKYHPIIKAQKPDIHNNDISVIVGKKWKSESEKVKAEYQDLAASLKKQHAQENPGYQYTPRKPSEKKKRMTAKKLAKMHGSNAMLDIADHERTQPQGEPQVELDSDEEVSLRSTSAPLHTAEEYLGTARPAHVSHLHGALNGHVKITLPANNMKLQDEVASYTSQLNPITVQAWDPANREQVTASVPAYVSNDQDFFDSLVDWEGIAADVALVQGATDEEIAQLADLELGNPYISLTEDQQRAAFEAELERTMKLF